MDAYWCRRKQYAILVSEIDQQKISNKEPVLAERKVWYNREHEEFLSQLSIVSKDNAEEDAVVTNLCNWVKHESWTYCESCKLVQEAKLLPSCGRKTAATYTKL